MKKNKIDFNELVKLMSHLRGPKGCPWDRAQTHRSLLKFLREETHEVNLAVKKKDFDNLKEELGDVLLQVLFHSELARAAGRFDIYDVLGLLREKLIRRHPHVFGKDKGKNLTLAQVHRNWKIIKSQEKSPKP